MPQYTKPSFTSVWADSGSKTEPTTAKINQGWIVEIPPHEMMNWLQNRQDQFLAHVNQMGIPQWDANTEYQAQKSYVQGTSGVVYRALQTHTNRNPDTDVNGFWSVAFESSGTALLKSQNLADVPDKPLARQNLGIASTSDYDTRYLLKSSNFADVPNKASARNNLEVYSRQEVLDLLNVMTPAGEVSAFARLSAPEGWLVCDGSAVNRVTYSRLFSAVGTIFGAGNGTTTFNLPDLRGEFIRGWDAGRGIDNQRVLGSTQAPTLVGGYDDNTLASDVSFLANKSAVSYGADRVRSTLYSGATGRYVSSQGYTTAAIGDGFFGATRPTNMALLYCIRT